MIPQFNPTPIIGQRREQVQAHVQAAIGQIAMGIYTQLATQYVATIDQHQSVDPDRFRQLAKDAVAAAKCYFEALGVIEKSKENAE